MSFTEMEKLQKDPSLHFKVNIGLPQLKPSRSEELKQRISAQKHLRSNPQLIKPANEICLGDIHKEWLKTSGPFQLKVLAEHFNIFSDLFGEAYFVPRVALNVNYTEEDGGYSPVYFGNQMKPFQVIYIFLMCFILHLLFSFTYLTDSKTSHRQF